ncbi:hypothetical protein LZ012_12295 [Dechloromonas sp. XY25]|uniref:Uncharacterized protein n=1 Tax=Dechloromonas hankyongensis TaxID=2908002 RepID=A0ABS9K3X5_9RHOO|nr:hypothetical protein [Dechloromonas hankyongensis]MCG2577775.1 hypothetical protein [Dechloromonas hankyongensis]
MSLNNNDPVKPVETTPGSPLTTEEIGTTESMNAGRRKIARLGVGAPLVLTLASRSVLANQCLSNMLSGNLSDPTRDSICQKGWSPGGWGQPGGMIGSYTTLGAWQAIGYNYGTLKPNCSASQVSCYTGGTKMSGLPSWLNKDGVAGSTRVVDVLLNNSAYNVTRHLICAYFNAKLGELGGSFHYVMTVAQLQQLASGALLPPGGMSISAFLDSTWA